MTTAILDEFDASDLDLLGLVARTMESTLETLRAEDAPARRRAKQHDRLLDWGRAYLPHYFSDPSSKMHEWLAEQADASRVRRGRKVNCVGPREGAKSTVVTTTHVLRAAVERTEPLIWILGETQPQADTNLSHIKTELAENGQLARDYPDAAGRGPEWRTSHIVLNNGVVIESFGVGSRIRGRRRGAERPTLIVADDLQSDAAMHSPERREKDWAWLTGALLKAGSRHTNVFNLANAVHRDAIGMRLTRTPGWHSQTFAAILEWPEWMDGWRQWAAIWNNLANPGSDDEAETFFLEHAERLLAGAVLLWPEHEDLLKLMQIRESDGHQAFEREKQSRPINPDLCEFPEDYFDESMWFEEWPTTLQLKTLSLDPSKGKDAKRGDYSAYVKLGVGEDGMLYVQADMARRPTPVMVDDGAELCLDFKPDSLVVETNQYQELLENEFDAAFKRFNVLGVPIDGIDNRVKKEVRIRRLGKYLSGRRIRFKSNCPSTLLLVEQLKDFPLGDHDDGPDALEMAIRSNNWLTRGNHDDGLGDSVL